VTVCVAAMCGGNSLFGASDRMLTAGDVEFEPVTPKLYSLSNSTVVMIAGEASLQIEILQKLFPFVTQRITENRSVWVPIGDLANRYHHIYQEIKSSKAEARVLAPLGLNLDTFIKRQNEMASSIVEQLTKEIVNFEMPPIEAIVAGIDDLGAHIYVANNNEVACRDAIGFAAIGAGYWHANSQFMFAGHNRLRPIPETLLLTYAAKKRAEVAPGVGAGTDMFTLGPAPGSYSIIREDVIAGLDKIYKHTTARAIRSVKMADKEVNKYVEGLAKVATPQAQETLTAKPTNGKDTGEEITPTPKPN